VNDVRENDGDVNDDNDDDDGDENDNNQEDDNMMNMSEEQIPPKYLLFHPLKVQSDKLRMVS